MLRLDLTEETYDPPAIEPGTSDAHRWDAAAAGWACRELASRLAPDRRPRRADMGRAYAAMLRANGADEVEIETLFDAWSFGFDLAEAEAADDARMDARAARQRRRRA
jgi:hypothetical protein